MGARCSPVGAHPEGTDGRRFRRDCVVVPAPMAPNEGGGLQRATEPLDRWTGWSPVLGLRVVTLGGSRFVVRDASCRSRWRRSAAPPGPATLLPIQTPPRRGVGTVLRGARKQEASRAAVALRSGVGAVWARPVVSLRGGRVPRPRRAARRASTRRRVPRVPGEPATVGRRVPRRAAHRRAAHRRAAHRRGGLPALRRAGPVRRDPRRPIPERADSRARRRR
jgi:hypothetical protein